MVSPSVSTFLPILNAARKNEPDCHGADKAQDILRDLMVLEKLIEEGEGGHHQNRGKGPDEQGEEGQ